MVLPSRLSLTCTNKVKRKFIIFVTFSVIISDETYRTVWCRGKTVDCNLQVTRLTWTARMPEATL